MLKSMQDVATDVLNLIGRKMNEKEKSKSFS